MSGCGHRLVGWTHTSDLAQNLMDVQISNWTYNIALHIFVNIQLSCLLIITFIIYCDPFVNLIIEDWFAGYT